MVIATCPGTLYDKETDSCSHIVWVEQEQSSGLPPLTISEAEVIAASVGALWALAFGIRSIARYLRQS